MLYNNAIKECQGLEKEILALQKKIDKLPQGKLICAANGKHIKWYCSDGHKSVYLPKKERTLAEQLASLSTRTKASQKNTNVYD